MCSHTQDLMDVKLGRVLSCVTATILHRSADKNSWCLLDQLVQDKFKFIGRKICHYITIYMANKSFGLMYAFSCLVQRSGYLLSYIFARQTQQNLATNS